ncbi:MAG TPA: hypothetical protein VFQ86_11550 [Arachidicoccus soli]|uniref:Small ribosomal subunit protein cS23 n=2 Tax=Euglena myxocylindracea TaxID=38276 RepID=RRP3_EUGMY|nr:RecName: Full=Small ribosomal subunit protein cS23; AltName: Full=30S ribosomal protein 3, chloroplastic; Short=PSRP-3 [Euglena myxocylindracea]AAK27693.1 ycf65 [Euglena myxocylindracea]AAQ84049.1 hypothetical chloroplast protein 65 [Euglena myxocylindracea]HEU0228367.1 hypothetical protein [Arachidicoccus soli]
MQKFVWKVVCLENKIAICLDQQLADKTSPVTEYFFWPQSDAWDELNKLLESKPWITLSNRIFVLNILTDLINYWDEKKSFDQSDWPLLKEKFPDVVFIYIK